MGKILVSLSYWKGFTWKPSSRLPVCQRKTWHARLEQWLIAWDSKEEILSPPTPRQCWAQGLYLLMLISNSDSRTVTRSGSSVPGYQRYHIPILSWVIPLTNCPWQPRTFPPSRDSCLVAVTSGVYLLSQEGNRQKEQIKWAELTGMTTNTSMSPVRNIGSAGISRCFAARRSPRHSRIAKITSCLNTPHKGTSKDTCRLCPSPMTRWWWLSGNGSISKAGS